MGPELLMFEKEPNLQLRRSCLRGSAMFSPKFGRSVDDLQMGVRKKEIPTEIPTSVL
jgi:hypothetical protein